jgi:hypothetical protein
MFPAAIGAKAMGPTGIVRIDSPLSVNHVFTAEGWFGLDIAAVIPGEPKPTILRVALTKEQLLSLLTEIEATRQQFGFPMPAVFSQKQTPQ